MPINVVKQGKKLQLSGSTAKKCCLLMVVEDSTGMGQGSRRRGLL
jgi:hypothetical protein